MIHSKSGIEKYTEECCQALKSSGARITSARKAVIKCLAHAEHPVSPRQILQKITKDKDLPSVDQVSVYRVLERLVELGLVHQVFPTGSYVACFHSRCSMMFHVLTNCRSCGQTKEEHIPRETLAPVLGYLESALQFSPDAHLVQISGSCRECLNKQTRSGSTC